ncbi:hypothetical protein [Acinetobacter sp. AG3]|uniref:hypothetical protein n=1 Tax=unclassified Acinetobacter TaxID=196816 RepID=UPI001EF09601|nr:hypothetical protein [Acinetobacter sp. AG3]MCG7221997.1 hypothetical protein [Acinetobacter sp. AG3]
MDKLDHRKLTLIKRAAEDAIHACNRHYGPFVDVVAHPLNIIALVEMAQSRQAEVDELSSQNQILKEVAESDMKTIERLESVINLNDSELKEKDKRIESAISELESLHNKKWAEWKEQADMHSQGEANAYEHAMQILERALRGEHE